LPKWIARVALAAYLALLLDLTLVRFRMPNPDWNWIPLKTIRHDFQNGGVEFRVNTLGNIAATIPFGILVPVALQSRRWSASRVAAATFGLSLIIEIAQAGSRRRVADVDDLILNTLGGLVGYSTLRGGRWLAARRHSGSSTRAASPEEASKTRPPGRL